jgi:hypothetical protein
MLLTWKEAEKIRLHLGDDVYQFSVRIGYSPNAYRFTKEAKKGLSTRMAREIWRRYNHLLKEA